MITDERIEAGARGICAMTGDDPDQKTYAREMVCTGLDAEPKQRWEYWVPFARAALTAALGDSVVDRCPHPWAQQDQDGMPFCAACGESWNNVLHPPAIKTVPGWRPIETAPRDGTPFLCFHPADGFSPQSSIDLVWYEPSIKSYTQDGDTEVIFAGITHWRPLPAAPGASLEDGQ